MLIDSHLHIWQRKAGAYSWLVPDFGALYDDFPPEAANEEVVRARVDGAVLVQADDTLDDALYMFEAAKRFDWALGVVAWIPLDSPDQSAGLLERYLAYETMAGVRQLVHDDPRDNFYRLSEVHEVAELLAAHTLPLDIPDAWPRDLPQVVDLATEHPNLTVVLDHMGKPPVDQKDFAEWLGMFRAFSELPNTVVKFSGLHHPERPFTPEGVSHLWDLCLELLGPTRMMVGSDWPITVNYGGYQPTWHTVHDLLSGVSASDRRAIGGDTALRVYGHSKKIAGLTRNEDI